MENQDSATSEQFEHLSMSPDEYLDPWHLSPEEFEIIEVKAKAKALGIELDEDDTDTDCPIERGYINGKVIVISY